MAKVIFVEHSGATHEVDASLGLSVMDAAVKNNVPGVDGDCGGTCSCATCHVYVDEAWRDKVGAPSATELSLLQFAENSASNSRLACQIKVTDALDGLTVCLPESQH
jgi:2Fe-2S ferredoxin